MSPASLESARAAIADEVKLDVLASARPQPGDHEEQMRSISHSFISDTLTAPTKEMYTYAMQSSIGDDVYYEPSTAALEAHMAKITGKEAGIFMASGSMSNQIALRSHLKQPPYSVLVDLRSHINKYETGGTAFHSGATAIAILPSKGGHLTLSDVEESIVQGTDVHIAPTHVIALENTLSGQIFPQKDIIEISEFAHSQGIIMHLDGARIWHVAAEMGTPMKELCDPFDSVSICFSKGLGAPVGSCLVGSKEFIDRARWFRKLFGGGMRQIGFLSGAAAYALTHNYPQLPRVHALATKLAQSLKQLGVTVLSAETCMVFYDPSPLGLDYAEIAERGNNLPNPLTLRGSRLVIHIQTAPEAVDSFLKLLTILAEEKRAAGFVPAHPEPQTAAKAVLSYVTKDSAIHRLKEKRTERRSQNNAPY